MPDLLSRHKLAAPAFNALSAKLERQVLGPSLKAKFKGYSCAPPLQACGGLLRTRTGAPLR